MRHFLFGMGAIAFIIFSYGFLFPLMISYPDTILVLAGLMYATIVAPLLLWGVSGAYIKSIIKKMKGEK